MSNAVSQWLGLINVLCENKAVPIGRFVASVTRGADGGEVKAYLILKTGASPEMTKSQDSTPLPQKAITVSKKRKRTKKARPTTSASMDITPGTTHSEPQPSATERTETDSLQEQNPVLSGEAGQQVIYTELGPFRKEGEKDGPKRRADSTEKPQRKYYRPMANAKTYIMNGQGQLQCQQDPRDTTRVGSVKELPVSREKPIFHEPLIKDAEQLTSIYPNSFDRFGSLKGGIYHQDRPYCASCITGKVIPLRLHDRLPQPKPPFNAHPINLTTPAADITPRPEPTQQREEDHDNVPDTGSFAESSMADTSDTSESSPGYSSTTETGETTDTDSSKTSGSTSSSKG